MKDFLMIGLIIVAHSPLASSFKKVTEHVVGPQEFFETLDLKADDDREEMRDLLLKKINQVDNSKGVIILTDMFGGTPSNLAISTMDDKKTEVIAGINLPLLIKLCSIRDKSAMRTALSEAQNAGKKYIHIPSSILNS